MDQNLNGLDDNTSIVSGDSADFVSAVDSLEVNELAINQKCSVTLSILLYLSLLLFSSLVTILLSHSPNKSYWRTALNFVASEVASWLVCVHVVPLAVRLLIKVSNKWRFFCGVIIFAAHRFLMLQFMGGSILSVAILDVGAICFLLATRRTGADDDMHLIMKVIVLQLAVFGVDTWNRKSVIHHREKGAITVAASLIGLFISVVGRGDAEFVNSLNEELTEIELKEMPVPSLGDAV